MNPLILIPALAAYFLAAAGFMLGRARTGDKWKRWATLALGCGALAHAAALVYGGIAAGNIPVANFAESLSFLGWLTALAGLVLIVRFRMAVVGGLIAWLIFAMLAIAIAANPSRRITMPAALRSAWLPVHVTLAFAGFALFVLAAGVSVIYLLSEHRLKSKRPLGAPDERAPSLEKLDRINYRLLASGFVMLTLAIISGAFWADATWGRFWSWEPQETWSLIIWLMYAGLLEFRLTAGWRGRSVAALTIVVFSLLVGSFVGVSLVEPGKHGGTFG
jgi:cytochrome c-type biogenesis protein CcsB